MELLFNLVWLMTMAAAFAAICRFAPTAGRRGLITFGVLFCASVLLFPAISVSDDLNSQVFTAESGTSAKRIVSALQNAGSAPAGVAMVFALTRAAFSVCVRRQWLHQARSHSPFFFSPLLQNLSGRAPPFLALYA